MFSLVRNLYLCVIIVFEASAVRPYLNLTESELLDSLCPRVDICDETATSAIIQPNGLIKTGFISCCQGCSCHPSCIDKQNCCYPDGTVGFKFPTKCLPTRIGKPADHYYISVPAYLTITQAPKDGCKDQGQLKTGSNSLINPSCDKTNGTVLDTYFPVYSKTRNEIYKTPKCAKCHGVTDARPFMPSLVCELGKTSMSERLAFFETGILSKYCHLDFDYDDHLAVSPKRCYRNVVDTCLTNEIRSPNGVELPVMDIAMVTSLCETSVYSPFVDRDLPYRNVFCYMCSPPSDSKFGAVGADGVLCPANKIRKTSGKVLVSLLDPRLAYSLGNSINGKHHEACIHDTVAKKMVSCRHIYCPSGQLRGPTGKCHYVTTHWLGAAVVQIMLTIANTEVERIRESLQIANILDIEGGLMENSPWSNDWTLFAIYRKVDVMKLDACMREILILRQKTSVGKIVEIIEQIKQSLSQYWQVTLNGTKIVFEQSLLKSEISLPDGVMTRETPLKLVESPSGCNETIWNLRLTKIFNFRETPYFLKKLALCEQVQLFMSEFEFDPSIQYIQSNLTKRTLYTNEFDLIQDTDRIHVRVCLSDTIFIPNSTNASIRMYMYCIALALIVIRLNSLSVI